MSPKGEDIPIVIRSRTARNWLRKLGYEYKDVRKEVFVDGHERADVVEDRINFLQKMEELKPYIVEFGENGAMKPKVYPADFFYFFIFLFYSGFTSICNPSGYDRL